MELTYEQHNELLKLANYLAKVRLSNSKKGIEMDSLMGEHRSNTFISYSQNQDKKDSQQKNKSVTAFEMHKA